MLTDAWLDLKLNWCHLIIKKVEFEAHLLYRAVLCVVGVEVTRLWYVSHYKLFQRLRGLNPSLFRRGFFNVRISAGIMIDRSLKKETFAGLSLCVWADPPLLQHRLWFGIFLGSPSSGLLQFGDLQGCWGVRHLTCVLEASPDTVLINSGAHTEAITVP